MAASVEPIAQGMMAAAAAATTARLTATRRGGTTAARRGGTTAVAVQEAEGLGLTGQNQGSPERERNNKTVHGDTPKNGKRILDGQMPLCGPSFVEPTAAVRQGTRVAIQAR
jgi:hypothetical protein